MDAGPDSPANKNGLQNKQTGKQPPADYDEAIKACGYGKFNYLLLITLIPACCAQVFATGTMSYVLPSAECELELSNVHKGALNAGAYAGMIMSAFLWGFILDVFGRRKLIVVGFLLDFTFNFLACFAHRFWLLLLLKICGGLSIPGPNAAVFAYVAETHSSIHRPKIIMITGGFFAFAQAIQPTMAYLLIPLDFRYPIIPEVLEFTSWRLFMVVCSTPSFISAMLFLCYPESPKFLMSQGRNIKALESFKRIYATNSGKSASLYPVNELERPPKNGSVEVHSVEGGESQPSKGICTVLRNGWLQVRPIFRPPYFNVAILLFCIQVCTMVCFNSIRLWTPQLFASLNVAASSPSPQVAEAKTVCDLLTFAQGPLAEQLKDQPRRCLPIKGEVYLRSLLIGVAATASFVISTPLVGCIGKRNVAKICFPLGAVMAVAMNWATNTDMFTAFVAAYIGVTENGLSIMSSVVVDSFPTAFRSMALSLQMMCGRIGSMSGNLIFPLLLSISCSAVFFSIAGLLLVVSILLWIIPKGEEKL